MERSSVKRVIQAVLLVALILAAVRLAVILHERHQPATSARPAGREAPLNPEAYVVPRKLHAYDLKSARRLTQQPVWVKEGFRYAYYPFDTSRRRADLRQETGELGPLERLEISDVIAQPTPGTPGQRQVLAVFAKEGKSYAVPVGLEKGGDYRIYADEVFFYQDPQQLYDFWPADIWHAIHEHQVTIGMNEWQAAFAAGMGTPRPGGGEEKVVAYPRGGRPLVVTYSAGKVIAVRPGP
jgi:hypothetical protein